VILATSLEMIRQYSEYFVSLSAAMMVRKMWKSSRLTRQQCNNCHQMTMMTRSLRKHTEIMMMMRSSEG
jgi:nitrate/TMAO reductase-like tetraheme cytochrome c subunit